MIFDQEKVEKGILVPNSLRCPSFTGSMLTFQLGRLLEKAQRVYWMEKARRKNKEAMWDMPPPLIMEEDEHDQEQEHLEILELEKVLNSPSSSCSDYDREPELDEVGQETNFEAYEASTRRKHPIKRSVQCQTSLHLFDDNLDGPSNENTCTSDDSSSSPKEEESEQWENLCAAVDNVLSKANLLKPQEIQVKRPTVMKKKKRQRKRATAIREQKQKKSAVKPEETFPIHVKEGGYTDPQIDYLFDAFSTLSSKSPLPPELAVVIPLNTIIEPPPPVKSPVTQPVTHPELLSPIPVPVSPTPIFDRPRVSQGLEFYNVPNFVGSLLPSKMGIILNRAHQAFVKREKAKQMNLMEAKLPKLIPISDEESLELENAPSETCSSIIFQPCEQEFLAVRQNQKSYTADKPPQKSIDPMDATVNVPRQLEELHVVKQSTRLNGLKFDSKSIERILNMIQTPNTINGGQSVITAPDESGNKFSTAGKSFRKAKNFEVVHLDSLDVRAPNKQKSTEITEAAEDSMTPAESIPLPKSPPLRMEKLCYLPQREFFPLPSRSVQNNERSCGNLEFKSKVLMDMSAMFDQRIPSRGIEMKNIPKLPSTLLSTKIGLVFEKAGKAFRIDDTRQRSALFFGGSCNPLLTENQKIFCYSRPPILSSDPISAREREKPRTENPFVTEPPNGPKKMRLAGFYGVTNI